MLTISPFLVIDDNTNIKIKVLITTSKLERRTKELNGSNEIHRYVSKNGILKRTAYSSDKCTYP